MSEARADLGVDIDRVERFARNVRDNVGQVLVGGESTTDLVIAALLARGHVLIEDVPGTGKTTLARAMAASLQCEFRRIQFTPDLVPADVLGVNIYDPRQQQFNFNPGPIFSQVLLADEINRATPRTQSALLEAMQEGQVSIDGVTARLPEPFFVIATLNPVEMEGTFPLPEAQLDRFLVRVSLGYPSPEQEERMLVRFRDRPGDFELAPVAGRGRYRASARVGRAGPGGVPGARLSVGGRRGEPAASPAQARRKPEGITGPAAGRPGDGSAVGARLRSAGRRQGVGRSGACPSTGCRYRGAAARGEHRHHRRRDSRIRRGADGNVRHAQ